MIATTFTYTVAPSTKGGVDVVLTSNDGVKQKRFYIAAGTVAGLTQHMESLTDENCDGFFPAPRVKKSK